MGTDLFTSARGPGLIGTAMALVVILGFGSLYLFVFDERLQGGDQTIESIIEADSKHITDLSRRLAASVETFEKTKDFKKMGAELRSKTVRRDALQEQKAQLASKVTESQEQLAKLEETVEDYKRAYRASARTAMVGREMDELKTTDGKSYVKVKVTDIDPVRMQIRHQGGITGVPLETLPLEMLDYLQLDENEKKNRLAKEADIRASSSQAARSGKLQHRIATLKHSLGELTRKRRDAERLADRAAAAVPALRDAIARKQEELALENSKAQTGGISNAPQVRAEIQQLEAKMRNAVNQGPSLRDKVVSLEKEIRELESRIASAERELQQQMADKPDDE